MIKNLGPRTTIISNINSLIKEKVLIFLNLNKYFNKYKSEKSFLKFINLNIYYEI
jgi:hypothetical protein